MRAFTGATANKIEEFKSGTDNRHLGREMKWKPSWCINFWKTFNSMIPWLECQDGKYNFRCYPSYVPKMGGSLEPTDSAKEFDCHVSSDLLGIRSDDILEIIHSHASLCWRTEWWRKKLVGKGMKGKQERNKEGRMQPETKVKSKIKGMRNFLGLTQ